MTKLDSILKSRDIILLTWVQIIKAMVSLSWVLESFPGGSHNKESACNAGDLGLIPGLGKSPSEGNDNPLQYSFMGNPMDRGAWKATYHEVTKS